MIQIQIYEPVQALSQSSTQSTRRLARARPAVLHSEIAGLRVLLQHERDLSSEMMVIYQ